jgi:group I intron endonuclease
MIVYKAENKVNGCVYIGATTRTLNARKTRHERDARNGSKHAFHQAIREHGADNFEWSIIDTASTAKELNEKEKRWIAYYRAEGGIYNVQEGGNPMYNAETRQRVSEAMRNVWQDEGRRRKYSEAQKGEKNHKAKISAEQAAFIRMLTPVIKTRENMKADFEQGEIAEMFGVNPQQISRILNGENWRHLPPFEVLRDEFRRLYEESKRER